MPYKNAVAVISCNCCSSKTSYSSNRNEDILIPPDFLLSAAVAVAGVAATVADVAADVAGDLVQLQQLCDP